MVRLISVDATSAETASVACSDEAKRASHCTSGTSAMFGRVMIAPREMMPAQHSELSFPIMLAPWCPVMLRDFDGGERLPVPLLPINFAAGSASTTGIRI
jgi:hypothetical protein